VLDFIIYLELSDSLLIVFVLTAASCTLKNAGVSFLYALGTLLIKFCRSWLFVAGFTGLLALC